jgi:hypothetical protein
MPITTQRPLKHQNIHIAGNKRSAEQRLAEQRRWIQRDNERLYQESGDTMITRYFCEDCQEYVNPDDTWEYKSNPPILVHGRYDMGNAIHCGPVVKRYEIRHIVKACKEQGVEVKP